MVFALEIPTERTALSPPILSHPAEFPIHRFCFFLFVRLCLLTDAAQVESTHATPYTEDAAADDQSTRAAGAAAAGAQSGDARPSGGNGIVGSVAGPGGGGGGGDGKNGVKQRRRRSSTALETGRKALQHRGVGYPMTAVAAVLRQLHMRVLSVEEMKMLDQVRFFLFFRRASLPRLVCDGLGFLCVL